MKSRRNYEVKFQLYGKAMKATVLAKHEDDAKDQIREKLRFDSVEEVKDDAFNDAMQLFDDFEGTLRLIELGKKYDEFPEGKQKLWGDLEAKIGPEKFARVKEFAQGFRDIVNQ